MHGFRIGKHSRNGVEGLASPQISREKLKEIREDIVNGFKEAMMIPPEKTLEALQGLDMIVVLEGNTVVHSPEIIRPTTWQDFDNSPLFDPDDEYRYIQDVPAMLAGGMRPLATGQIGVGLGDQTPLLVFAGGNPVSKEKTHEIPHSGSEVYKALYKKWLRLFSALGQKQPWSVIHAGTAPKEPVVLSNSENSRGDMLNALKLALEQTTDKTKQIKVGFLSNDYHLPRLEAMFENLQGEIPELSTRVVFVPISAEDTILSLASETAKKSLFTTFENAYSQDTALNRIGVELVGTKMTYGYIYKARPGKPSQRDSGANALGQ